MSYKSATNVLPEDLLVVIQNYIDGAYIYIPRKQENKKSWGEVKNSKQRIKHRNDLILSQYQDGISVMEIAEKNFLSPKTIYKILAVMKK